MKALAPVFLVLFIVYITNAQTITITSVSSPLNLGSGRISIYGTGFSSLGAAPTVKMSVQGFGFPSIFYPSVGNFTTVSVATGYIVATYNRVNATGVPTITVTSSTNPSLSASYNQTSIYGPTVGAASADWQIISGSATLVLSLEYLSSNWAENSILFYLANSAPRAPTCVTYGAVYQCSLSGLNANNTGFMNASVSVLNLETYGPVPVGYLYRYAEYLKPSVVYPGTNKTFSVQGAVANDKIILTDTTSCASASTASALNAQSFAFAVGNDPADYLACYCPASSGDCTNIANYFEAPMASLFVRPASDIIVDVSPRKIALGSSVTVTLTPSMFWGPNMQAGFGLTSTQGLIAPVSGNSGCTGAAAKSALSSLSYRKISADFRSVTLSSISTAAVGVTASPGYISFCVCMGTASACSTDAAFTLQSVGSIDVTPPPTITSLSVATRGTAIVTITGENFTPGVENNLVSITSNTNVVPLSATNTTIVVKFTYICCNNLALTVTSGGVTSNAVLLSAPLPEPSIAIGEYGSSTITIFGSSFSSNPNDLVITWSRYSGYKGLCFGTWSNSTMIIASCNTAVNAYGSFSFYVAYSGATPSIAGWMTISVGRVITSVTPASPLVYPTASAIDITLSGPKVIPDGGYVSIKELGSACSYSSSVIETSPVQVSGSKIALKPIVAGIFGLCYCPPGAACSDYSSTSYVDMNLNITFAMGSNFIDSVYSASLTVSSPFTVRMRPTSIVACPYYSPIGYWTNTGTCTRSSGTSMTCTAYGPSVSGGPFTVPASATPYKICLCIGPVCNTPDFYTLQTASAITVTGGSDPEPSPYPSPDPNPNPNPSPSPNPSIAIELEAPTGFVSPSSPVIVAIVDPPTPEDLIGMGAVGTLTLTWTVVSSSGDVVNLNTPGVVGQNSPFIRLPPNLLSPATTYTFTVAGSLGSMSGLGSATVKTAGVPVGGSISISPNAGQVQSFTTQITLSTASWTDSKSSDAEYNPLPMQYIFAFRPPGLNTLVYLSAKSSNSSVTFTAPPVRQESSVTFFVLAVNAYGASSNASVSITISPANANPALAQNLISNLASNAQALPPQSVVLQVSNIAQQLAIQPTSNNATGVVADCLSFLATSTNPSAITSPSDVQSRADALQLLSSQPAALTPALVSQSLNFIKNLVNVSGDNVTPTAAANLLNALSSVMAAANSSSSLVQSGQSALNSIALSVAGTSGIPVIIGGASSSSTMGVIKGSASALNSVPVQNGESTVTPPDLSSVVPSGATVGLVNMAWNSNPFPSASAPATMTMSSKVVTVNLVDSDSGNSLSVSGLYQPIQIQITSPGITTVAAASCRYYSTAQNAWVSDDGCKATAVSDGMTTCSCNHLTDFAVFQQPIPQGNSDGSKPAGNALLALLALLIVIPIGIWLCIRKKNQNKASNKTTEMKQITPNPMNTAPAGARTAYAAPVYVQPAQQQPAMYGQPAQPHPFFVQAQPVYAQPVAPQPGNGGLLVYRQGQAGY